MGPYSVNPAGLGFTEPTQNLTPIQNCVCVCVCEREREPEPPSEKCALGVTVQ